MYITDLSKIERVIPKMEGAKDIIKQVPLSKNDGAPLFSFRVFTIEPGGNTPFHEHPFEHMNYVIKGKGVLVMKDSEHTVKEGDFALVLPGEKHQYKNTSENDDFIMICAVPKEYE
ncbi:MAG: cupin domain-containing protein [Dehalococcoidales bacterium]|nr:cupin domain-containing protein [Dehalococcoidales bacterium]